MTTESDQLYAGIKRLDQAVAQGQYRKPKRLWGGAGVGVVDTMPTGNYNTAYKYVVTPYAAELSWLIARLWRVFREHPAIDYMTKFEFFGRLANAASNYQSRIQRDEQLQDL